MRGFPARDIKAVFAFVVAQPILGTLHEILVLGIAAVLEALANAELLRRSARLLLSSPVRAELLLNTLGGTKTHGIAIGGTQGDMLYRTFPSFFLQPEFVAPGAWVSAVIDPNSTVLGRFATLALVEILLMVIGAALIRLGLRGRGFWSLFKHGRRRHLVYVVLGFFVQAQAIWQIFRLARSPRFLELRDMGIGVALSLVLQTDPGTYAWLMDEFLPIFITIGLATIGLVGVWLVGKLFDAIEAFATKFNGQTRKGVGTVAGFDRAIFLTILIPLIAVTPLLQGFFSTSKTSIVARKKLPLRIAYTFPSLTPEPASAPPTSTPPVLAAPTQDVIVSATPTVPLVALARPSAFPVGIATLAPSPVPFVTPTAARIASVTPTVSPTPVGPTKSEIQRTERGLLITINGQARIITGMNYNVNYTGLPDATKRELHHRDFRIMRAAGVNAIVGWGVYDEVTLDLAREYGIGVVMPFELDPKGPYEHAGYRGQIKEDFRAFVQRFQKFPAVWAWNPGGDELLHRMDTDEHRTTDKLQIAADLLTELAALAYTLDPNHVSIIKEPRDWYIPYFDQALKNVRAQPQQPDPSLYWVYGLNVYGHPDDVADAIRQGKINAEERMRVAQVVGEYAPFGLPRADRAIHYAMIWDDVYRLSPNGGFVYVFGPDQPNPQAPNPYDPLRLLVNEFSLVDMDGNPVDDTLSTLAARWRDVQNAGPP